MWLRQQVPDIIRFPWDKEQFRQSNKERSHIVLQGVTWNATQFQEMQCCVTLPDARPQQVRGSDAYKMSSWRISFATRFGDDGCSWETPPSTALIFSPVGIVNTWAQCKPMLPKQWRKTLWSKGQCVLLEAVREGGDIVSRCLISRRNTPPGRGS